MPKQKRIRVKGYPGIYYIEGTHPTGKQERIYYAQYKRAGKLVEEKIGCQYRDHMTPALASRIRVQRIDGKQASNRERREVERKEREEEANRWTVRRLFRSYKAGHPHLKGIALDESRYRCYLEQPFGAVEPKEIRPLDVDRLRVKLLKTKAPNTVKNTLELLRRLVNYGVNRGLCEGLSFKVTMPKVNNEKTEDLEPEELKRLLGTLDEWPDVHLANAMKLALYTGMRRGEILRLQGKDVDFRHGLIHIRDPKGGRDQTIPMNVKARALLQGHPRGRGGRGGLVFRPAQDVACGGRAIRKAAELPDDFRPFHGLRHTYASRLASSGQVDLYALQRLLTHKNPAQTQRYAHLRDEALQRATDVLSEVLDEEAGEKQGLSLNRKSG